MIEKHVYKKLIAEADQVAIQKACELIGMKVTASNRKMYCPFGNLYHSDGGASATMRIYESNTIYCFNCMISYTPVALVSRALDISRNDAALRILESAGISRKTLQERWLDAISQKEETPDQELLAEALKTYCNRLAPDTWNMLQLDSEVSSVLNRCFELLSLVKTNEDADLWLASCKTVLNAKIKESA